MMWEICRTLGPDHVTCLTGVSDSVKAADSSIRVYRAPQAFSDRPIIRGGSMGLLMSRVCLHRPPDVLQLATCYEGWLGLLVKRVLGIPFVIYAHGNEILEATRDKWNKPRAALNEASRVLACSRFTESLVEDLGICRERIVRINPGCDSDRFRPDIVPEFAVQGISQGDSVILTVGNLVERKGHDVVIRAVALIREQFPRLRYVIVGDGPYRTALETLASSLGVNKFIVFAGRVSDSDLPQYYALSDIVIMASRQRMQASDVEGFGITFLEAGACGRPVIAGRSGGTSDAVVDGVTGLLVDPEDPADIARTLAILLAQRETRQKMGDEARRRILTEFTWRHVGERVRQVLQDVVASS